MALYPYQERVKSFLLQGKSVVLASANRSRQDTGRAWRHTSNRFSQTRSQIRFPRKCIYSVPMRVLANQFE